MNIRFVIWMASIVVIKSHNTDKTCSKFRLSSLRRYRIFVPVTSVYAVILEKDCKELNANIIEMSDIPEEFQIPINDSTKYFNLQNRIFCKFNGTVLRHQNDIKFMNGVQCLYNSRHCFVNNLLFFWESNSNFEYLTLFEGNLYIREIKISQPLERLFQFTHEKLNLTLNADKEFKINNEAVFFISKYDVFVKLINQNKTTATNNFLNTNIVEKYLGKLTNKNNEIRNETDLLDKNQHDYEMCSQSRLISYGQYQIIVPIISIYYYKGKSDCEKDNGASIKESDVPITILSKIRSMIKIFRISDMQQEINVCKINSTIRWSRKAFEVFGRILQYNLKSVIYPSDYLIWDITSKFEYLTIFQGNLYLRETKILGSSEKLLYFSHDLLKLALRVEDELQINNETFFSISKTDVLVKLINPTENYGFVNNDLSEKYLGKKLTLKQERVYFPEKNPTSETTSTRKHPLPENGKKSQKNIVKTIEEPKVESYNRNVFEIILITIVSMYIIIQCICIINIWIHRDALFC